MYVFRILWFVIHFGDFRFNLLKSMFSCFLFCFVLLNLFSSFLCSASFLYLGIVMGTGHEEALVFRIIIADLWTNGHFFFRWWIMIITMMLTHTDDSPNKDPGRQIMNTNRDVEDVCIGKWPQDQLTQWASEAKVLTTGSFPLINETFALHWNLYCSENKYNKQTTKENNLFK